MVEFLYMGTKAGKLNTENFVAFFPDDVDLKSTEFVVYWKVRPKMTQQDVYSKDQKSTYQAQVSETQNSKQVMYL